MRRLITILLLTLSLPVLADANPPLPKDLQPVPEPPPAPAGYEPEPSLEPQVTITKRGENQVEEFRIGGQLYMMKITPPHGVPYYLVDEKGDGHFTRQDNLDPGVRVPQWVLFRF